MSAINVGRVLTRQTDTHYFACCRTEVRPTFNAIPTHKILRLRLRMTTVFL